MKLFLAAPASAILLLALGSAVSCAGPGDEAAPRHDVSPWKATPIGAASCQPELLVRAPEAVEIAGEGAGFGPDEGQDDLAYWSRSITGDFRVTLRVRELAGAGTPTVGLMLRETLTPNSRYSFLGARLDKEGRLRPTAVRRQGFTGSRSEVPSKIFAYEREAWLRLTRSGDQVSLHHSPDGETWRNHSWQWSHTLPSLPQTVHLGVALTPRAVGGQARATVEVVDVRAPYEPAVTTSWFGNTRPGFDYVPMQVRDIAIEPKGGLLAIQAHHDEIKRDGALWSLSGDLVGDLDESRRHHGGVAIAIDEQWVYFGRGGKDRGVMRYSHGGTPDRKLLALTGRMVLDLAAQGDSVWAIADDGFVHELSRELEVNASFELAGARSLAVDASGTVYVLRREEGSDADALWRLSQGAESFELVARLPAAVDGRGLAVDPLTGNLYLCDMGPAQRLHILNARGEIVGHLGAEGGVYSQHAATRRGETHPMKLPGPVAVAFDAEGMIYIASNGPELATAGSLDIRKFDRAGELLWQRVGLEFVDSGDVDPGDQSSVFTKHHRYARGSEGGSHEWSHAAMTLDPFRYPDDPRVHLHFKRLAGVRVRRVEGERIMFAEAMRANTLTIYRFEPNSEIAVPCGMLHAGGDLAPNGAWPASAPEGDGGWLWIDANGDGRFAESEFRSVNFAGISYVDARGGIWFVDASPNRGRAGDIYYLPCLGLTDGVPQYAVDALRRFTPPDALSIPTRFMYDAESDSAFVVGYGPNTTWDREKFHWADAGDVLVRIDGFVEGDRRVVWSSPLPNFGRPPGDRHASYNFVQFDQAGDYVFGCIAAETLIYAFAKEDGRLVDDFRPGPEVGGYTGLVDITSGIKASATGDGSYLIVTEEDARAKGLVLEWRPPVDEQRR